MYSWKALITLIAENTINNSISETLREFDSLALQ